MCLPQFVTIDDRELTSNSGMLAAFPKCPSDGGSESSLMSPWARMMAASKGLAILHVIPHMAASSALKTFKLETIQKKTFSLMKSE
jgi:hypothetical protein